MSALQYRLPLRGTNAILILVVAAVFLSQLGSYSLLEPDEGRYAEIAREMAESGGDWLIPKLIGVPHFQKPPFYYWITALSIKFFGVNETSVRLPGALAAVSILLFSMGISYRLFDRNAVKFTLLILASCPLFPVLARLATPDMTMTMWITVSIYCLVRSREGGRFWGWLFFLCAGIGFLTKGPVAFLIPFSAAIAWSITSRRFDSNPIRLPWLFGVSLALLVGLSWFIAVVYQYPELAAYFWDYELVQRVTSANHGRSRPFWFFIPVLICGILPWCPAFLRHIPNFWKDRNGRLGLFLGWLLIPFLILSLSGSKLPTYILPLFPGIAVLLGGAFRSLDQAGKFEKCFPQPILYVMAGYLIAVSLIPMAVWQIMGDRVSVPSLFVWIWIPVVIVAAIFWLVRTLKSPRSKSILIFAALAILVWVPLPSQVDGWNNMLKQQASVKPLAKRIQFESEGLNVRPRVILCNARASGLAFYLGRLVENIADSADIPHGLEDSELFSSLPETLHKSIEEVGNLKPEGSSPIFVLTRKKQQVEYFDAEKWEYLQTAGDFVLLRRTIPNPIQTKRAAPIKASG